MVFADRKYGFARVGEQPQAVGVKDNVIHVR